MKQATRRIFCLVVAVLCSCVVPFAGVAFGAPAWLTLSAWLLAVVVPFITDWIIYEKPAILGNFPRWCSRCGGGMFEGYCLFDGLEYFCCKRCLYQGDFTTIKFEELYAENQIYWTDWHDLEPEHWHNKPTERGQK